MRSDPIDKDLIYSMENTANLHFCRKLLFYTCLLLSAQSMFGFIETKRFDAKPPPRAKYLVNTRPATLRYADPVVVADRKVLLSLSNIASTPAPMVEQNATKQPDIPLIAYEQDEISITSNPSFNPNLPAVNTSEMMGDDTVLPAPDPFDESGVSGNIDSTDDLLNLFEQTSRSQNIRPGYNAIPFIPPFTSAPDNLRVESRASYKKVRK